MVVDHSAARCSKRPGAVAAPKFIIKIVPLAAHLHSSFFLYSLLFLTGGTTMKVGVIGAGTMGRVLLRHLHRLRLHCCPV